MKMPTGSNKGNLSKSEELTYIATWFSEFSAMQKDDFLEIVLKKYRGSNGEVPDGISNGLHSLEVTDRPPSIFQCRMKLFNEWFMNWSDEDKENLLTRLENVDSQFMNRFRKSLEGGMSAGDNESYPDDLKPVTEQSKEVVQNIANNDNGVPKYDECHDEKVEDEVENEA